MSSTIEPTQSKFHWNLGQTWQVQPGAENVAQFQSLLQSVNNGVKNHASSHPFKEKPNADFKGSLIEKTALEVANAESQLLELRTEIHREIHKLGKTAELDSSYTESIVQQKYAVGLHAIAVGMVGNKSDSFQEELSAIQRGR